VHVVLLISFAVAMAFEDVSFFKTAELSIARELGISSAPGFVLLKNHPGGTGAPASAIFDPGYSGSDSTFSAEGPNPPSLLIQRLEEFIQREKLPDFLVYDVDRLEDLESVVSSTPVAHHVSRQSFANLKTKN